MAEKSFLSLEEIQIILPKELCFSEENKVSRGVFKTCLGENVAFVNSKLYPNGEYWYSVVIDYYAKECNVKTICFIAGQEGIFLIPIEPVLNAYKKSCGWKDLRKGHSYYVRIKIYDDGKCKLMGAQDSDKELYNITNYFFSI